MLIADVMWKKIHIPKLNQERDELCLLMVLKVLSRANGVQPNKEGHSGISSWALDIRASRQKHRILGLDGEFWESRTAGKHTALSHAWWF